MGRLELIGSGFKYIDIDLFNNGEIGEGLGRENP